MTLPLFPSVETLVFSEETPVFPVMAAPEWQGRIQEVNSTLVKVDMPWAKMGELCEILPGGVLAEVVSVTAEGTFISPFSDTAGLHRGQWVRTYGHEYRIALSDDMVGTLVDGLGRPLYGSSGGGGEYRSLSALPPDPMSRTIISEPMPLGVKSLDGVLTFAKGQRMGIFAAAGGGKSTLMSMLCDGTTADVIVIALVGERGREVREFVELTLSEKVRKRSVIVVATSERPAMERLKATWTATTIAEFFRDQGLDVLLLVDSLTRYARAAREVGLASGEPPVSGGFPSSVFANLPRLLERAGPAAYGSISAIYTVLVEGDNLNEPLADEVRSLLDGHIILSRKLAEANHYPAIDIGASASRVMHMVVSEEHRRLAGRLRRLMSLYKEIELLVRVGEYQSGQDAEADDALHRWPFIKAFLCQSTDENVPWQMMLREMQRAVQE
jgi:type III secretion protein N (ATPase)